VGYGLAVRLLLYLALLVIAGLFGYRLGRRVPSQGTFHEPTRGAPEIVLPVEPTVTATSDRRQVVEAAQELGRWLESAGDAPDEISPATWDRIAEASSRIAAAASRLSTRRN
jgi:hypothetical protein